jgi:HlyD family secretion protein
MKSLACLLLMVVILFGCERASSVAVPAAAASSSSAAAAPPIKVTPIKPVRKTLVRMVEQPGQVEAFEEAPLFAKVTGYVQTLHVDLGDKVAGPKYDAKGKQTAPGQELCELIVPELNEEHAQKLALIEQAEAHVKQAEAAIQVAEAALTSAQAKVAETEAAADRDQAVYNRWKSETARIAELAKTGALGQRVADETESQFQAADADRRQTAAKVRSATAVTQEAAALIDKAKADLVAAQARVKVAAADAERTKTMLDYTLIRAPFDGRIADRNIHIGHLVRATGSSNDSPLLVVVRIDKVRVKVDVPEADAVLIQDGCEATVRVPSTPGTSFPGTVARSGWSLDPGTRTLRVEIDVDNASGTLRQGMYVTSELKAAVRENVLALPRAAVLTQDKVTFCHVIDTTGKVVRAPVQLGIQSGAEVEIRTGLSGDEQVIGANSAAFKEGQMVEILAAAPAPSK